MQLFSHNLHPFYFMSLYCFLYFFLACLLLYLASQLVLFFFLACLLAFSTCFITLMLLAQPYWARICLIFLFVLLAMFMCSKLCLDAMSSASFQLLCILLVPFSCVWLLGRVQIQIQWSRPTSIHLSFNKGFVLVHFCMFVLCLPIPMLYPLDPCLYAQIQVFDMLLLVFPLWFVCLHLWCLFVCLVASFLLLWLVWM